jgi:transcriptional regulator with XRE-family HTH domain
MKNVASIMQETSPRSLVIGEVKAWMGRRGINMTRLGQISGTNQQYWSRRLTGTLPFDIDDLAALSYLLQVPMSTFIPEYTPEDLTPIGQKKGPAGGAARPSLPELDSNQQPAGSEFQQPGELIEGRFGDRLEVDARSEGTAVVTPFPMEHAS